MTIDMKTPEEILQKIADKKRVENNLPELLGSFTNFKYLSEETIEAMKEYGRQEFNRALDLAAKRAKVKWEGPHNPVVNKDSILNLKILDV